LNLRLFIAVDLSEEQKEQLLELQKRLMQDINGVKWVNATGLHITLKFLGEVENIPEEPWKPLLKAINNFKPFKVSFQGIGAFPSLRKPRVIWSGVNEGKEQLRELSRSIDNVLKEHGFSPEKKEIIPHVTLGRIRKNEKGISLTPVVGKHEEFYTPNSDVNYINLYQSILSPKGASYKSLQKIYFE